MGRLAGGGGTPCRPAATRGGARLLGKRARRCGRTGFALQCRLGGARAPGTGATPRRGAVANLVVALRAAPRLLGNRTLSRRRQLDTGAARLGKADGDRLPRRARAVLAFADVIHLLANELPCVGARGLSLAFVATCPSQGCFLRHGCLRHLEISSAPHAHLAATGLRV